MRRNSYRKAKETQPHSNFGEEGKKALSPKLETQRILVLPAAADYGHLIYFYDQASWDSIILSNIESGYFSWSLA